MKENTIKYTIKNLRKDTLMCEIDTLPCEIDTLVCETETLVREIDTLGRDLKYQASSAPLLREDGGGVPAVPESSSTANEITSM